MRFHAEKIKDRRPWLASSHHVQKHRKEKSIRHRCRSGSTPISTVMRRLLTGYALWYNKAHRRHGHLISIPAVSKSVSRGKELAVARGYSLLKS